MKYELAKELKDAGFPQKVYTGTTFYPYPDSNERVWVEDSEPHFHDDIAVKKPTLSELIEACGEGFDSLYKDRTDNSWHASIVVKVLPKGAHESQYMKGATPEEAVARLWLALNKK